MTCAVFFRLLSVLLHSWPSTKLSLSLSFILFYFIFSAFTWNISFIITGAQRAGVFGLSLQSV